MPWSVLFGELAEVVMNVMMLFIISPCGPSAPPNPSRHHSSRPSSSGPLNPGGVSGASAMRPAEDRARHVFD